jgi:hypothetical protein
VRLTTRTLGVLVLGLLAGGPAAAQEAQEAQPVVEAVRAGSADGTLVFEVVVSEPVPALALDSADPFTVSVFLGGAVFDFPPAIRDLPHGALRRVAAVVVARPDGVLARLDFVFDGRVAYRARTEGRRLFVHFDLPGVTEAVVFGPAAAATLEARVSPPPGPTPPATAPPPAAPPAVAPAPATAPPPPPPRPALAAPPAAATPPAAAASAPATAPPPPPTRPAPAAAPPAAATPPAAAAPAASRPPAPGQPRASQAMPRTAPTAPAPPAAIARIRRITPVESGQGVQLTVEADRALAPRAFVLSDPPRIVLDFDNAVSELGRFDLPLGGPIVERIRTSQFRTAPVPIVRVVVDVKRPVPYRVEPGARGTVVHIGAGP